MWDLYRLNRYQPGDLELHLRDHRSLGSSSVTSKGCVVSLWRWVRDLPQLNKAVHSLGDGADSSDWPSGRQQQRKEASSDGCTGVRAGFSSLPDHLLERILGQLATRSCSRQTHFNVCAVSRSWRAVGRQLFFASPWAEHRLLCHPAQLFCLSPRPVETSRTGLLKCFVRREARSGMRGYRRYYFYMGRDHRQLRKLRFLMCAVQVSRCEVLIYLNKEAQGSPMGRLVANGFCTRYSLSLAPGWQLQGAPSILSAGEPGSASGRLPAQGCGGGEQSAAGDPRRTLQRQPRRRWRQEVTELQPIPNAVQPGVGGGSEVSSRGEGSSAAGASAAAAGAGAGAGAQQAAPAVLGSLQYRARLRGFMQPRRVEVELPPLSQLSFGRGLPSLRRESSSPLGRAGSSRGASTDAEVSAALQRQLSFADSFCHPSRSVSLSPRSSWLRSESSLEQLAAALHGGSAAGSSAGDAAAAFGAAASAAAEIIPAGAAAVAPMDALPDAPAAWLPQQQAGRQAQQARQEAVVQGAGLAEGAGPAGEGLSLHNKQPQWNNDLRCWCLNFRGRVKQASVKNFQLVRGGDPAEKVVLQFGKVERDIYILDFNPTVVTSFQAFCVALSTFDSKIML